jgi:hypothetical protein
MNYASTPWARIAPITIASKNKGRPSFFARILEALHHSRRLQAENFIRTHRHLVAGGWICSEQPTTGGDENVNR